MGLFDKIQSLFRSTRLDVNERFELLREAISGTMSKFYMARDRHSGQVVGLKIGDREKVAFFESRFKGLNKPPEGQIAMGIRHPRIVTTLEYGKTIDDLNYIVMEFLPGPGLHALLKLRDQELVPHRVALVRQMAEAIREVHAQGYIHRDVCPRNFICSPEKDSLKLIDFGLTVPATKEFMQPGNRTGTPLYMAPEVVRRRWTDQRLDIFSLGVTAYQLCTFELPWPSSDTTGKAALAHDTDAPVDVLRYCPDLPPALASAIMRCLTADPNKRPQTMDELLNMIRDR
jgi:serine/threonine-protein kinase